MLVSEVMSADVMCISPEESVAMAAKMLARSDVGVLPVCASGARLKGMLTDRDIVLRCVAPGSDPEKLTAGEIMSRVTASASPTDEVETAVKLMSDRQLRRLPVVSDGRVVGMLSLGDIVRRGFVMEASMALGLISSRVRRL